MNEDQESAATIPQPECTLNSVTVTADSFEPEIEISEEV